MPTLLTLRGYRFFFFSGDRREPPHVHVEKDDAYAKYWLQSAQLARSRGFRSHELREVRDIVVSHRTMFIRKWNEHFAGKG